MIKKNVINDVPRPIPQALKAISRTILDTF